MKLNFKASWGDLYLVDGRAGRSLSISISRKAVASLTVTGKSAPTPMSNA
ncbi:hypothetical protein [Nostoc sp.]